MTTLDVLKLARTIVDQGGDPEPCQLGAFCLRCCISKAKTELGHIENTTDLGQTIRDLGEILTGEIVERESDMPLVEARELVAKRDSGIAHTKESALAILDAIIHEVL